MGFNTEKNYFTDYSLLSDITSDKQLELLNFAQNLPVNKQVNLLQEILQNNNNFNYSIEPVYQPHGLREPIYCGCNSIRSFDIIFNIIGLLPPKERFAILSEKAANGDPIFHNLIDFSHYQNKGNWEENWDSYSENKKKYIHKVFENMDDEDKFTILTQTDREGIPLIHKCFRNTTSIIYKEAFKSLSNEYKIKLLDKALDNEKLIEQVFNNYGPRVYKFKSILNETLELSIKGLSHDDISTLVGKKERLGLLTQEQTKLIMKSLKDEDQQDLILKIENESNVSKWEISLSHNKSNKNYTGNGGFSRE